MGWPINFGTITSPEATAALDTMFNQVGAQIQIPCSASGVNAISLTPLVNCPALTAYNELGGYRFRAAASSTGPVTAQYNSLGFLNVYHGDAVTQASTGDLVAGQQYALYYSASLAGGAGGFFLEQPAFAGSSAGIGGVPGGRLTLQSATPVMVSTQPAAQTVYYAPYVNQFVPIWNGSTLQAYNFCSSLSDQVGLSLAMGGSASWPSGTNFDVYVTLNGGVPVLATVAWTNQTTRATTLSIFGGMLTNSTLATMRISAAATISVPANQGTLLGTFATIANGQSQYIFGGAASGGTGAGFFIANYYNKVLVNTIVEDIGTLYTYTTATGREARASVGNQIAYVQADSERAALFNYNSGGRLVAATGAYSITGIGFNSSSAFSVTNTTMNAAALTAFVYNQTTSFAVAATGLSTVTAMEQGDGVNANSFDFSNANFLFGSIWL
jgi:hypothetical protein